MKISAGLVILFDNKILLGHPTNSNWENTYSIPKGQIEFGESALEAAIRETSEEVGLKISKNLIDNIEHEIFYKSKNGKIYKKVVFFIVKLDRVEEIIIPKSKLQSDEIDWAGFLPKNEAILKINPKLINVLDFLK